MKVSFAYSNFSNKTIVFREPDDEFDKPRTMPPEQLVGKTVTGFLYDKHGVLVLELEEK